jgi:carboxypeptidase C (cathepsin A)
MQEFFKAHPEYAGNELYITGESYAGHYVPAVTSRIHQANKEGKGVHVNLKVCTCVTTLTCEFVAMCNLGLTSALADGYAVLL